MTWRMVCESDHASLSIPLRYLSLSGAYLDSALRLCTVLKRSPRKSNYARSSVVLHLTFHAIELFLKCAILERKPKEKFRNHDIQGLSKQYKNLYPAMKYEFQAPFISGDLSHDDLSVVYGPERIEEVKKYIKESKKKNPLDQRHRYPCNNEGEPWGGYVGFEPGSFLVTIKKLKTDIAQLESLIFPASLTLP